MDKDEYELPKLMRDDLEKLERWLESMKPVVKGLEKAPLQVLIEEAEAKLKAIDDEEEAMLARADRVLKASYERQAARDKENETRGDSDLTERLLYGLGQPGKKESRQNFDLNEEYARWKAEQAKKMKKPEKEVIEVPATPPPEEVGPTGKKSGKAPENFSSDKSA